VRVASSNLVIRSKKDQVSGPTRAAGLRFRLAGIPSRYTIGFVSPLNHPCKQVKMAEKSISQKSSDDSASKAVVSGLRAKGSGGVYAIRPGAWRVDIELPRDKVTGKRRRVSRYIEGARSMAEVELSRLRVADNEKRLIWGCIPNHIAMKWRSR